MKNVIKKDRVELVERRRGRSAAQLGAAAEPHSNPSARLIRVDGRVQAIEFTCACGDKSVLEIDYDDQPASEQ